MPGAGFVLPADKRRHMLAEGGERHFSIRPILRPVGQRQRQSQRRKTVAAAPSRLIERRVAVQAVFPQVQSLHETQVPQRHPKIARFSRQPARAGKDGAAHENRIAHLVVERHGASRRPIGVEPQVRRPAHQVEIRRLARVLVQIGEQEMSGEDAARDALAHRRRSRQIRRGDFFHVRQTAARCGKVVEAQAPYQRERRDVGDLIESMSVCRFQLLGNLDRVAPQPAAHFLARGGRPAAGGQLRERRADRAEQALRSVFFRIRKHEFERGYGADSGGRVASRRRQPAGGARVANLHDQVGRMHADEPPEIARFRVPSAVSGPLGRKIGDDRGAGRRRKTVGQCVGNCGNGEVFPGETAA